MKRTLIDILVALSIAFGFAAPAAAQYATLSGTTCPGSGCTSIAAMGGGTMGVQLVGPFVGTITFTATNDTQAGTTYTPLVYNITDTSTPISTTTSPGMFIVNITGVSLVKVTFTSYMSGSAKVYRANSTAKFQGPGSGGGSPGGSTLTVQFNNSGAFGGVAHVKANGGDFLFAAATAAMNRWEPTNFATQNGAWQCRTQMQDNPNDAMRRDDTVGCGWNGDGSLAGGNSSQLVFESYYKTNAGARQSETYFTVSDGVHGHRPWALYYDIDGNVDTQLVQSSAWSVCDITDCSHTYLFAAPTAFGADWLSVGDAIPGTSVELRALDSTGMGGNVDLGLRPLNSGHVVLPTLTVNTPIYLDNDRNILSGTFHGSNGSRDFATVSGSTTTNHVAKFDANGDLVDGGAGSSGCAVAGSTGSIQFNDGASGCAGGAGFKVADVTNPRSVILNDQSASGSLAQFIIQDSGAESLRLEGSTVGGAGTVARLLFADGNGGSLDTGITRSGAGAVTITNATDGNTTGTTLNVAVYKAGGTSGVTASGSSCTITAIKGGIITGATCAP